MAQLTISFAKLYTFLMFLLLLKLDTTFISIVFYLELLNALDIFFQVINMTHYISK